MFGFIYRFHSSTANQSHLYVVRPYGTPWLTLHTVAAKLYPAEIRSTGVGWAIGLGRLGAVLGPGIAGYMIAMGVSITANFLVFAIPMLIGGILAYKLRVS